MKNLVTVTCNRDFHNMILQAESIQKFVEPCTHWIVINEFDNLDIDKWDNTLKPYYTSHQYKILTPNDFEIKSLTHGEWHSQQFFKIAIANIINEDYLILDTKCFFIKPVSLDEWDSTMGSGVLHKFGESIDGPPWEDISQHYAKKLNTTPITHFLFNVPFKINIDILKNYNMKNLIDDLYPTKDEEQSYFELTGKKLFPSEFILYSYLARDSFHLHNTKPRSSSYIVPAHLKNKNDNEILVEIIRKTASAEPDKNITSFAFHPLIFNSLSNQHIQYINHWLSKMNFSYQFTLG